MNDQPLTSSGAIAVTAGTQVMTGPGVLGSATITAAAANSTVQVYDGTSTAGLLLMSAATTANTSNGDSVDQGLVFNTGLFVVVTGAAAVGTVKYRRN